MLDELLGTDLTAAGTDMNGVLTLAMTDIDVVSGVASTIHNLWSSVLEAAIAIYLLDKQIAVASVVPVLVAVRKCNSSSRR